ncbi:MAG: PLP-dependent aminotransferase family protein [Clostridia bacterium]|nr:PLP-dependent aminotransferase family protein [Clostridia bacterium]
MKKYLEVYEKIKNEIISKALVKGDKLPSKRTMASEMKLSVISVEHAYELLVSEGYIESKERRGYFVSFTEGDFYSAAEPSNIDYPAPRKSVNEGLSFDKLAKITRYVLSSYGEVLLDKTENKGAPILRTAIKRYLARNKGINVDEEQIVVGSGAEYLYGLIIELIGEDRVFGIEAPGYKQIERVYGCKKANYESLRLSSNGIPTELLKKTKATILHVTPYRSYPTGACADVSKKAEYVRWAKEREGFIIEDDYESEFSITGSVSDTVFSLDKDDRVIYVNTFSKTIAHSIRVGYMILPRRLVKKFDENLGFYTCAVPSLEQYLIATVLNDGTFEKHVNRIRRQRRAQIKD